MGYGYQVKSSFKTIFLKAIYQYFGHLAAFGKVAFPSEWERKKIFLSIWENDRE
jgi:hypothetical protein